MKRFMLFIFVLSFFLISCRPSGESVALIDYRQGVSGLQVEPVRGLPPDNVFVGSDFQLGYKVRNLGGYDAVRPKITIVGFNSRYLSVIQGDGLLGPLSGRSISVPDGSLQIAEFSAHSSQIPFGAKRYVAKYSVFLDYGYSTFLSANLCVNPNFYDVAKSSTDCKLTEYLSFSGQGAPVAVSKIRQNIFRQKGVDKLQYEITVSNVGRGSVVGPVRVSEAKIGTRLLTCDKMEVRLDKQSIKDGKNVVVCSIIPNQQGSYETTLNVELFYNYRQSQQFSLTVQDKK